LRIDQRRNFPVHLLVSILKAGSVLMPFVEMQQPPHHLQQMKNDRKIAAQLFELAIAKR
jgi:hypothetical protein